MAKRFGERERFAVEIGDAHGPSGGVWEVDVWAADRWLTCDDNVFRTSLVC